MLPQSSARTQQVCRALGHMLCRNDNCQAGNDFRQKTLVTMVVGEVEAFPITPQRALEIPLIACQIARMRSGVAQSPREIECSLPLLGFLEQGGREGSVALHESDLRPVGVGHADKVRTGDIDVLERFETLTRA